MRDRLNLMQQFCDQIKARFQGINLEYNETEMKFGDFCEHLAKIEATAKRLQMTSLLADLLKQTDSNEVSKVVMLSLGRLAPLYKDIDFGLAEKTIIRSLAAANGVETDVVVGMFKKLGDLGEVAFKLKAPAFASRSTRSAGLTERSSAGRQKSKISISDVYDLLFEIAEESGEGSQEKKVNKTADLLRELDPLGAKYAVRIILGNLRLGFSDKTVLDALSVIIAGDKSAREKLEQAYNVRPDVGWLAQQVKRKGSEMLEWKENEKEKGKFPVSPKLGVPILPALCQRLPAAEEIIDKMCRPSGRASSIGESGKQVAVEPKWDGQRIQAHAWTLRPKAEGRRLKENQEKKVSIKLFTRSLEDITPMFPDLVDSLKNLIEFPSSFALRPSSFILDGEAVAIDPQTGRVLPFQTMITRKRKYGIAEKLAAVPVRYMVFDILYLNGKSLMGEPFYKRRQTLEKVFNFQNTQNTRKTRKSEIQKIRVPETLAFRHSDNPTLRLSEFSEFSEIIQLAPQLVTSTPAKIRKFLKQQIDSGLEGIVAKRSDAPYIPGRTQFAWVKLKWEGTAKSGGLLDTVDCVVMGTYAGRGKRSSFGVGAFLVGVADQEKSDIRNHKSYFQSIYKTISKIGTGLTDEQWKELKAKGRRLKAEGKPKEYDVPKELTPDTWLRPELVVEIQADNITNSPLHTAGYALRFPRLVRYRTDKRPEQATTIEEIKNLYKTQK